MPVLHEYKSKPGFYIVASFESKITTYQITPGGLDYLRRKGYMDGASIRNRDFQFLHNHNYIYTGKSGRELSTS